MLKLSWKKNLGKSFFLSWFYPKNIWLYQILKQNLWIYFEIFFCIKRIIIWSAGVTECSFNIDRAEHCWAESVAGKDHVYRMVIVKGCCTMARSSSLGANGFIGWHKSIVSSDWSDTMVWFGQILLYFNYYHPIHMILDNHWYYHAPDKMQPRSW